MDKYKKVFTPLTNKSFNFAIKVKTNAKSDSIENLICIDQTWYIKITVKASPENGKANKAIIDLLSYKWSVPQNAITIIRGASNNYKILNIKIEHLKETMLHFSSENITKLK